MPEAARPSCGSTGPARPSSRQNKVIAYLEGNVEVLVDRGPSAPRLTDQAWLGRFFSSAGVQVRPRRRRASRTCCRRSIGEAWSGGAPNRPTAIGAIRAQPAQFAAPGPAPSPQAELAPVPAGTPMRPPGGAQRAGACLDQSQCREQRQRQMACRRCPAGCGESASFPAATCPCRSSGARSIRPATMDRVSSIRA